MTLMSALADAGKDAGTPMVRSAGCIACWRFRKVVAVRRACGRPNPILLAL